MMNIKQIKSVLIKIWAIVFLVLFSTWLIGGCIYNSIGKESIQEDIQQLKQELYSIKPIQNYFVKMWHWQIEELLLQNLCELIFCQLLLNIHRSLLCMNLKDILLGMDGI